MLIAGKVCWVIRHKDRTGRPHAFVKLDTPTRGTLQVFLRGRRVKEAAAAGLLDRGRTVAVTGAYLPRCRFRVARITAA